jgi:type IV pilus assembly protein PilM
MVLDYQVLNIEEKTNNMNILLAASTKDMLQTHTNVLGQAGIAPNLVDVDPLAVANSFALNAMVEDGVYIVLNIGAHRTNLVIFGPKAKFFARDVNFGGMNFTKDIMRNKNLSFEEAEEYKFENGIGDPESESASQSISLLDISEKSTEEQIVEELRRSLRYYVKEAGNSDYRKVILMGGGAKMKGLAPFIESKVNIPTEIFDPFVGLEMPEKLKDKQDPQLSLAIGLAMRGE